MFGDAAVRAPNRVKRAARALLPIGGLIFVLGVASVVLAATVGHGAAIPIAFGELAISFGITCFFLGLLAWIVTRRSDA